MTQTDAQIASGFARRLRANADRAEAMKFGVANLSTMKVDDCRALADWIDGAAELGARAMQSAMGGGAVREPLPAVEWAVERWEAEVKHRPLVNVHRRPIDDTWRQVIRYFGGDPEALCGPAHDDLIAANPNYAAKMESLARAEEAEAARKALEAAAQKLERMNDPAGDRASYDNREMSCCETERMYALRDAAKSVREDIRALEPATPQDARELEVEGFGRLPVLDPATPQEGAPHPDDIAVDRFAAAMKAKLAKKRAEGYGGWEDKEDCPVQRLSGLLRNHVEKGDPVDVGNLAMMLHQRGERIGPDYSGKPVSLEGTRPKSWYAPPTPAPEPGSFDGLDVADLKKRLASNIEQYQRGILSLDDIEKDEAEAFDAITTLQQQLAARDARIAELEGDYEALADTVGKIGEELADAKTALNKIADRGTVLALRDANDAKEAAEAERDALKNKLASCQWYWPEDDTESENCQSSPGDVVEAMYGWETPSGEVVAVARGGIVEVTYCAALPPADDADSDDWFWVEERTREAAQEEIAAEIKRRAALSTTNAGGGDAT